MLSAEYVRAGRPHTGLSAWQHAARCSRVRLQRQQHLATPAQLLQVGQWFPTRAVVCKGLLLSKACVQGIYGPLPARSCCCRSSSMAANKSCTAHCNAKTHSQPRRTAMAC